MTVYEYRCGEHGGFDRRHPIGTAPDDEPCPVCTVPARRAVGAPALARVPRGVTSALETQARSGERPGTVRRVPSPEPSAPAPDPRRAGLPRP